MSRKNKIRNPNDHNYANRNWWELHHNEYMIARYFIKSYHDYKARIDAYNDYSSGYDEANKKLISYKSCFDVSSVESAQRIVDMIEKSFNAAVDIKYRKEVFKYVFTGSGSEIIPNDELDRYYKKWCAAFMSEMGWDILTSTPGVDEFYENKNGPQK